MLKKLLAYAGLAIALATAASAGIPVPPCNPCLVSAAR